MAQNSSDTALGSMKGAARQEAGRLASDAKTFARDASGRGSRMVDGVLETGRDYATQARATAERIHAVGQKRAEEAAFHAELGYEEAADAIRRHPAQAMGLAVGVGVLIGLLIARR